MPLYQFKRPSTTTLVFYFLLIILVVFVLFNFTELKNSLVFFREIKPIWFILAVTTQILTYVFVANIYRDLLHLYHKKSLIPQRDLFNVSLITLFMSQIIPLGALSSQGYLIHFLQKKKVPSHISFSVAILETFTYYFAHLLFSVFMFVYLIIIFKGVVGGILLLVAIFGVFLFLVVDYLILMFSRKKTMLSFSSKVEKHKWLKYLFNKIKLKFPEKEILHQKWEGIWRIVRNKNRTLLRPLFWQIMLILADASTVFLLFNGFGFKIKFTIALIGMMLTKIVAMVSISPGALLFFEGAMVLFYSAFNIPLHLVIVVTLLFRALSFWLPMLFGLFFYKRFAKVNNL